MALAVATSVATAEAEEAVALVDVATPAREEVIEDHRN